MAKKKHIPQVSYMDMNAIYRKVLSKVGESYPPFLIFDDQPFDAVRFRMPCGNDVLYFNNCDNICDKIIEEINSPHISIEDAPDFMIHSLTDEEVSLLNTVAVILAEMLEIPYPQIEFRDNMGMLHGSSIGEINLVTIATVPSEYFLMMVRFMAHEFRHLWQYKNHPEYNESYKKAEDGAEEYLDCIAENDAEAFASRLILEVLDEDDITENDNYAMGNRELKERIVKMRDEIELDEEWVYRLRALFGIE